MGVLLFPNAFNIALVKIKLSMAAPGESLLSESNETVKFAAAGHPITQLRASRADPKIALADGVNESPSAALSPAKSFPTGLPWVASYARDGPKFVKIAAAGASAGSAAAKAPIITTFLTRLIIR
jgi:hypothetical protein